MKPLLLITSLFLCSCQGYTKSYAFEYKDMKISATYIPTGKQVVPSK